MKTKFKPLVKLQEVKSTSEFLSMKREEELKTLAEKTLKSLKNIAEARYFSKYFSEIVDKHTPTNFASQYQ